MSFENYIKNVVNNQELEYLIPEILSFFKELKLSKNNYLVKKGEICNYFCFIESGILQHSIEISEEEKTTYLGLKTSSTSALKSYLQKTP